MNNIILNLENINKSYRQANGTKITILQEVNLSIRNKEMVALIGPSGSGKSTLLHLAGLLDQADSGRIWLCGQNLSAPKQSLRTQLRGKHLGFIYQFHHLLPEFNALENAAMPLTIAGINKKERIERAKMLLIELGLENRLTHRPSALSGGEQQRVAIARALVHRPNLILADEPTGNLDPETANNVIHLFMKTIRHHGTGALIVTHNMALAARCDRIITLNNKNIIPADPTNSSLVL
jgi:lipoprotein-releasing system ATP-binding protein